MKDKLFSFLCGATIFLGTATIIIGIINGDNIIWPSVATMWSFNYFTTNILNKP